MKKYVFSALMLFCAHASAYYPCWDGDVGLIGGYRIDRITTTSNAFNPPGTLIVQDRLKGSNINIYEMGIRGSGEYCDWFMTGFAKYGWVGSGNFSERTAFPILVSDISKGRINNGHTNDYSIGLGYHLYCFDWFKIAPILGYSYNYEKIKMGKISTNDVSNPVLNHLSYNMRWQGPWLGVESDFWISCLNMRLGYEHHWSNWKAGWNLSGPDIARAAFSDKRKSNNAYGDVIYIDGEYEVCNGWDIGLAFKYQYWKAKNGSLHPKSGSFVDVDGNVAEVDNVPKATWTSYEFQLRVGYNF